MSWYLNNNNKKHKYTEEEKASIIEAANKFNRDEIVNSVYNEHDIFNHIYNKEPSSGDETKLKPKRQPNPFMIFRIVLGKIASKENIKIGDGMRQSQIAGFMWSELLPEEKERFNILAVKFKDLHKEKFPDYEYKPKQKNPVPGSTFIEPITRNNYESTVNDASNNRLLPQQPPQQQPIPEENNYDELLQSFMMNGDFQQFNPPVLYQLYQQQSYDPLNLYNQYTYFFPQQLVNIGYDKFNPSDKTNSLPQETQPSISYTYDPNTGNPFLT